MWLLLPSLLAAPARAADVLVFGDSWAEGSADELQDALAPLGLEVVGYGIGGTTADQYANVYPTAIPAVIVTHPEARWVWLSMGGNDLFANYYAGNGASNAAWYEANFRTVLDQIESVRPDMRVVSFGYDFVNFEQSTDCIATAWTYFGVGTLTPTINGYFYSDIRAPLTGIDPDRFRFTYVDQVWGTLQAAGGIAGAPDLNLPSPAAFMADCIHPTSEGYRLVHQALVDAYWGLTPPVARIEGPTEVCTGEESSWTDTSTGAVERRWWLDEVEVGSTPGFRAVFAEEGEHLLELHAGAGAWEDEAALTLVVARCEGDGGTDGGSDGETDGGADGGTKDTDSEGDGESEDNASPPDTPAVTQPPPPACTCATTTGLGPWVLVVSLLVWPTRRRRPQALDGCLVACRAAIDSLRAKG